MVDNNIILTAVTDASYFYKPNSTVRLQAATLESDSLIGFMVTSEQNIDVYSPMELTIRSPSQHRDYVALAWHTGGLAFDLAYFTNSSYNLKSVVTSFNTLMFTWGSYGTVIFLSIYNTYTYSIDHLMLQRTKYNYNPQLYLPILFNSKQVHI